MTDRYAVIWTRAGGQPVKMGNLVATDRECRLSYDSAFLKTGLPGFSLIAPPHRLGTTPVVHRISERFPLHPRLMAMIPPNTPGNLQRRVYAELLAKQKPPPAPGFETEWAILMLAGRNGIGHLDVFPSDSEAERWYAQHTRNLSVMGGRSGIWRLLKEEIRQIGDMDEDTAREFAEMMGPTPSVGGMTTKLVAAIPDKPDWDGSLARPSTRAIGPTRYTDALIKIEQPGYEGVAALENLCYQVHADLGFPIPRRWLVEIEGLQVLAVERFDRTTDALPIPFESLLTIFAGGSVNVASTSDLELTEVAGWIKKLAKLCSLDVQRTLQGVFRRIAVALMTGNGDLHLDNLGLLGGYKGAALAPIFDPAPMRAWPRHNLRLATPIVFQPEAPIYRQIAKAGASFGFSEKEALEVLLATAEATHGYIEQVKALARVPQARKRQLIKVVKEERESLLKEAPTKPRT
jgi:serine/threonine-protein kinase HipA